MDPITLSRKVQALHYENPTFIQHKYYHPEERTLEAKNKAYLRAIHQLKQAFIYVDGLKNHTIIQISTLEKKYKKNANSLLKIICNIWIWIQLKRYGAILKNIEAKKAQLENQKIKKYHYIEKYDCQLLLNTYLYNEDEPLAEFMREQGITLKIKNQISTREEKLKFNNMLITYLKQKPGFEVALIKFNLAAPREELITSELFNEALNTLNNLTFFTNAHVDELELRRYLPQEEIDDFQEFLKEKDIHFDKDQEISQGVNRGILVRAINEYLGEIAIGTDDVSKFFEHPGKIFAKLIAKTNSFAEEPWSEERAQLFLRNCYLLGDELASRQLTAFLARKDLKLKNYALLQTPLEVRQLNLLIIEFLGTIVPDNEEADLIISELSKIYGKNAPREGMRPFTHTAILEAYNALTALNNKPSFLRALASSLLGATLPKEPLSGGELNQMING